MFIEIQKIIRLNSFITEAVDYLGHTVSNTTSINEQA